MGCLSCITEPPRRPHLASDVFGFHREEIGVARIKYCYINSNEVHSDNMSWKNAKGRLISSGFIILGWEQNILNILGYIPLIGLFPGIMRFNQAATIEHYNGREGLKSPAFKTAQVIRGIIECLGFGSVFLVADFLIWIGREINWCRFDGMYYIGHEGKIYDTDDPAIQDVKAQVLKLGVTWRYR